MARGLARDKPLDSQARGPPDNRAEANDPERTRASVPVSASRGGVEGPDFSACNRALFRLHPLLRRRQLLLHVAPRADDNGGKSMLFEIWASVALLGLWSCVGVIYGNSRKQAHQMD